MATFKEYTYKIINSLNSSQFEIHTIKLWSVFGENIEDEKQAFKRIYVLFGVCNKKVELLQSEYGKEILSKIKKISC